MKKTLFINIIFTTLITLIIISCAPPVEIIKSERIVDHNLDNSLIEIPPFPETDKGITWTDKAIPPQQIADPKTYLKPDVNRHYYGLIKIGDPGSITTINGIKYYNYDGRLCEVLRLRTSYQTKWNYHSWDTDRVWPFNPYIVTHYHVELLGPPTPTATPPQFLDTHGYISPVILPDTYLATGDVVTPILRMWVTEYTDEYSNIPSDLYQVYTEKYTLRYMESHDNGVSWTPVSGPFAQGLDVTSHLNDKGGIIVTDVKKSKGNYFMWYLGKDELNGDGRTWRMYMAIFDQTKQEWQRQSGGSLNLVKDINPDGFDSYNITGGSAIFDVKEGKYKMWYSGADDKTEKIGYTEARNPRYWSISNTEIYKGTEARFDKEKVADPYVIKDGDVYKMWYSGFDGDQWRLGLAYSWDGKYFEYSDKIMHKELDLGAYNSHDVRYPFVIKEGDTYRIWMSVRERGTADKTWKIAYIESVAPVAP